MAEFYITDSNRSADAIHYVHKDTCEKLPEKSTLRYLGSFASGEAARYKSLRWFENVSYCETCFPQTAVTDSTIENSIEKAA